MFGGSRGGVKSGEAGGAGAAAVDGGFHAVLHAVGAGGHLADAGLAHAALAVSGQLAVPAIVAGGTEVHATAAAVDVGLVAVLSGVAAVGFLADFVIDCSAAHLAYAVRISLARTTIIARRTRATAAVSMSSAV